MKFLVDEDDKLMGHEYKNVAHFLEISRGHEINF